MNLFRRLGVFIENRRLLVIGVGALLVVIALLGAQRISLATGVETFLSPGSKVYQDYHRFSENFGSSPIIVLVTSDDLSQLLEPDTLKAMEMVENRMGQEDRVISAIGPAFLIKQAMAQHSGEPVFPGDPQVLQAILTDPKIGQVRPEFKSVFLDKRHAVITVMLESGLSLEEHKEVATQVSEVVSAANFTGVKATVTGMPVVMSQVEDSMASGLRTTMIVAVVLMLVVLSLIFRVRGFFAWRWLALGTVVIGTIYTFGLMGGLGVPISMVTMAIFAILIGLGVDYGIQFHNRYDEEVRRGESVAQAIVAAVTHMGPAVGIALVAVILGSAALFISPIPMIRNFGQMLLLGLIMCYLTALFLLLAILYWHDCRSERRVPARGALPRPEKREAGWMEKGLQRLAPRVIRSPAIILPVAVALTVGGWIADPHVGVEADETKFISQDLPALKDLRELVEVTGSMQSANILIEAEDVTDPDILAWMLQLEHKVLSEHSATLAQATSVADLVMGSTGGTLPRTSAAVKEILERTPAPVKRNLVSADHTAANLVLGIKETSMDQMKELRRQLEQEVAQPPPGVSATLTGMPFIGIELFNALTEGRMEMTLLGVALIFLALVLLFKLNLLKALMATLPIGLIIGWSSGIMYLLGLKFNPASATLGALILGIGAEYTILLMMRYYEERGRGHEAAEAMTIAMSTIGRAIIASGGTTIAGFGALLTATQFLILRDFAIVTIIDMALALVSTLVVLPPLVVWLDRWRARRAPTP